MAASTAKHLIKTLISCKSSYRLENVRYATGLRKSKRLGKMPELARTFEQRLAGISKKKFGGFISFEFPQTTFYFVKIKYISFTFKTVIFSIVGVSLSSFRNVYISDNPV